MTDKITSFQGSVMVSQVYALKLFLTMLNNAVHWRELARNDLSLPFQLPFPSDLQPAI